MKKIIFGLTLLTSTLIFGQTIKKVCFLGNSYTYVNDLPSLIDSIANHDGNDLIKDQNTPGGYTLEGHSTNTTSLSKISSDEWDYVVLQEQSQLPSFPYSQVITSVYPFATILSDSIRSANKCAIPLFYNTWGRRDGDSQWDSINTFVKMNNRLYFAYDKMAQDNRGKLSPIGIGFRHIYEDASSPIAHSSLYSGDGSHPSLFGSYLAACIFYNVIYEATPIGNTFIPTGINQNEATYLQNVAFHVVNEVDSIHIDYSTPEIDCYLGLNKITPKGNFRIYPNPSNGSIYIELLSLIEPIEIYNLHGQLVKKMTPTQKMVQFDLENGIYIIKIGETVEKVIVTQ